MLMIVRNKTDVLAATTAMLIRSTVGGFYKTPKGYTPLSDFITPREVSKIMLGMAKARPNDLFQIITKHPKRNGNMLLQTMNNKD